MEDHLPGGEAPLTAADFQPGPTPVLGLSSSEAARLLDEHGPNQAPRAKARTLASRVLAQLRDPIILLLCAVTAS